MPTLSSYDLDKILNLLDHLLNHQYETFLAEIAMGEDGNTYTVLVMADIPNEVQDKISLSLNKGIPPIDQLSFRDGTKVLNHSMDKLIFLDGSTGAFQIGFRNGDIRKFMSFKKVNYLEGGLQQDLLAVCCVFNYKSFNEISSLLLNDAERLRELRNKLHKFAFPGNSGD